MISSSPSADRANLAQFVAATLRDKAMMDVLDELEQTKARIKTLENEHLVRITGPGGFPVFAERNFKYSIPDSDRGAIGYDLELQNSTGENAKTSLASCTPADFQNCELHIGEKMMTKISSFENEGIVSNIDDPYLALMYQHGLTSSGWHEKSIVVEFGPLRPGFFSEGHGYEPSAYQDDLFEWVRFQVVDFLGNPFLNTYNEEE